MPVRSFYRYKARIIREEKELCDKIAIDNPKYRFIKLIHGLEEAVVLNKRKRDDKKLKPKEGKMDG